ANTEFLVDVTDFMVLISLGIITLSAIWLGGMGGNRSMRGKVIPAMVAGCCFVFGGAVYQVDPSVVVFGSIAVIFAYLVFDIIELGNLGSQLFLSAFGLVCFALAGISPQPPIVSGYFYSVSSAILGDPNALLFWGLLGASLLLGLNVYVDVKVLERTT